MNRFKKEILALHKPCENGEPGDIYYRKVHAVRRRAVPTWALFRMLESIINKYQLYLCKQVQIRVNILGTKLIIQLMDFL